jgi:hypothetical protein
VTLDRADRFGDIDMTTGGDTGEHPLHDDLAQQVATA